MKKIYYLLFFTLQFYFSSGQNLCGFWESYSFQCPVNELHYETFYIKETNGFILATKISGDSCVTGEEISWEGQYIPPQFSVVTTVGDEYSPNCCVYSGIVTVHDEWYIDLRIGSFLSSDLLTFHRIPCEKGDSLNLKFA